MATFRHWVGNSGNWSDTAHWSLTSGGAGGASVPTNSDTVTLDSLSFTLSGQTLTIDVSAAVFSFDTTGVTNSPAIAGTAGFDIYDNFTVVGITFPWTGTMALNAVSSGKTFATNGVTLNAVNIAFQGVGGVYTLQDAITTTGAISVTAGTFISNNKAITCTNFSSSNTTTRVVTLGTSVITCSGQFSTANITGLTLSATSSSIIMTGATKQFSGGGQTFGNVTFLGTPTTITGSNTFNVMTLAVGKTLKLTSGTTQTVTSLICNGTTASPSTINSVTAASAATIALPAGRYFIRHTSIKDITVTGATAVTSIAGTNVSGNTGITFVTKFEMGRIKNDGSFNWYSAATGTTAKVSG